jgi:hypothetical protein
VYGRIVGFITERVLELPNIVLLFRKDYKLDR